MIETSTPASQNLCEKADPEDMCTSGDLTDEEQGFYNQLQPELNMIIKNPSSQTVDFIINYSQLKK